MEAYLDNQLKSKEEKFKDRDLRKLRDNLSELEQSVIDEASGENQQQQQHLLRQLWFRLVKLSCQSGNVELALLAIAKLQFTQLALSLKSCLQSNEPELGEFIALHHVRDFFQLEDLSEDTSLPTGVSSRYDFFSCRKLIEFYVNKCDWVEALKFAEQSLQDEDAQLINQLIYHNIAQYHECDENPPEALVYHERLVSPNAFNLVRILLKLHQELSYPELKKYFSLTQNPELFLVWVSYALGCARSEDIFELLDNRNVMVLFVKYDFKRNRSLVESKIFDKLPERMLKQLKDDDYNWWLNKRNVDYLISVTSSLNSSIRDGLSELSCQYEQDDCLIRACSLFLCLNQTEKFLSTIQSRDLKIKLPNDKSSRGGKLMLASTYGSAGELLHSLSTYFKSQVAKEENNIEVSDDGAEYLDSNSNEPSLEALFKACLRLGLVDEALQVLSMNPFTMKNNKNIAEAIEALKKIISDKGNPRSLDSVDPIIHRSTLDHLYRSIQNTSQTLSTNVMTIVILSTTIFLLKLNSPQPLTSQQLGTTTGHTRISKPNSNNNINLNEQQVLVENWLEILESLFEKLVEFLRNLNFNASDDLINATNLLILAVKDKLETLSESDIIRESFKDLIEQIASRCMIESQYRSAAMLYSQIEDNVSAIKSLMRMGDVDVVINYSLLVRDITVNRLTINFLRHLQVDPAILKDFVSKSKL